MQSWERDANADRESRIVNCGTQVPERQTEEATMDAEEPRKRTKRFALEAIKLLSEMPATQIARHVGGQFVRCATSVGANHRAANRARSHAEFIAKIGIVEEEADESCFWLELMTEGRLMPAARVESLLKEARELTAIFTASGRTARSRSARSIRNFQPTRDDSSAIRDSRSAFRVTP